MKFLATFFQFQGGTKYRTIVGYFLPELVTSLILYCGLRIIDSIFISQLHAATYTTSGVSNTLFHFITKIADGLSVAITILCGQYNGIGDYKQTGRAMVDAFWTTCIIGSIIALLLYFGVTSVYNFYGVSPEIVAIGTPFFRLRAIGVFFNFVVFALIGFMRGVKNTRVPMFLFMLGGAAFVFFDYALIFGKFGFMRLEFQGSAMASILQYLVMFIGAMCYILYSSDIRKYTIDLFSGVRLTNIKNLLQLSWPVMLDKGTVAFLQIWLAKMVGVTAKPSGAFEKTFLGSCVVLNDLAAIAMLPALAFGPVITFLVSNDYGAHNYQDIKANIKKVLFMGISMVLCIVLLFCAAPFYFLGFFDKQNAFSSFAASVLPWLLLFLFLDVLQLVFAAALRGAANVKVVMGVRTLMCLLFTIPVLYLLAHTTIQNPLIHFILVYGAIYIGNGLMGIIYILYFRGNRWKKLHINET